ncbi:MAG: UvrD-helicase domain-containing protein [Patescibacteria group bacterium]|nr:UvrD-helicase domain-containing protein [bacterium]MDZ4241065.1 UvrD-helicase domain-containing protein [Patescibacteria group bacterium]
MEEKNFAHLNNKQKKAVLTTQGPLLVLAGAGAGKTKTITSRIFHLIKQGTSPEEILAITFTNKAAREMKERVNSLLEHDPGTALSPEERPFISTFHALAAYILRIHAKEAALPKHFKIFDGNDSRRAVKEAIERSGLNPKEVDPGKIQNIISREKGEAYTVEDYKTNVGRETGLVENIWTHYERILREERALDFDDLLLKAFLLLKGNEIVRETYQNRWKYIHVDEYQDTNKIQYLLVRLLSEKHQNLCVVGDIDQNIYSWRGAKLRNILDFEKDYPKAIVILLEENYRSTQTILNVANTIIEKNKYRKSKRLFTQNSIGEKIGLFEGGNETEEAEFVAAQTAHIISSGVRPEHIAVLYRANFQSRVLEEAFLARTIPYQLIGTKFFERKEVKDTLAFIHAALNPESFGDIKRIINLPPRGIGKVTLLKIFEGKEESLPQKTKEKIKEFKKLIERIKNYLPEHTPSESIKYIMEETGMNALYEKELDTLENLRELVTLASRYDEHGPNEGLERFLSDAALVADQDELEDGKEGVKLMTVHASKGLEFEHVFIVGLEDNLFPHRRIDESKVSEEDKEEERRLFYVALTRAKKKLTLSYAQTRTLYGTKTVSMPSEFIFDIPPEYLEKKDWTIDEKRKRGIAAIFSIEF